MSQPGYTCLTCASVHGEPASDNSENWFWRLIPNGRIGPFCSTACSQVFHLTDLEPQYTLKQIGAFLVLRVQARHEAEARAQAQG